MPSFSPARLATGLLNLCARMPLRVHYVLSDYVLYPLVRHVVRYRRGVVRRNLQSAFPGRTDAERLDIERRFYHYLCDLAVEIIRAHAMPEAEYRRRVVWTNPEVIDAAVAEGHDLCCCYLAHYLNWEWCVTLPTALRWSGMCQIYHPMRNRTFDRWFLDARARFGAVNVPMKHVLRVLLGLRRGLAAASGGTGASSANPAEMAVAADVPSGTCADAAPRPDASQAGARRAAPAVCGHPVCGYAFGCIADQLPKRENAHHSVRFLGRDTKVFTGSEVLGRKLGMPFFYARLERPQRGLQRITFEPMTEVDPASGEFAYTDAYMARLEAQIREHPEYWLWTHDRWKR